MGSNTLNFRFVKETWFNVLLDQVSLEVGSGKPNVASQNKTLEILPLYTIPSFIALQKSILWVYLFKSLEYSPSVKSLTSTHGNKISATSIIYQAWITALDLIPVTRFNIRRGYHYLTQSSEYRLTTRITLDGFVLTIHIALWASTWAMKWFNTASSNSTLCQLFFIIPRISLSHFNNKFHEISQQSIHVQSQRTSRPPILQYGPVKQIQIPCACDSRLLNQMSLHIPNLHLQSQVLPPHTPHNPRSPLPLRRSRQPPYLTPLALLPPQRK